MLFKLLHLFIVSSVFLLLVIKMDFSWGIYVFVLALLSVQLYLVYTENKVITREEFEDSGNTNIHPLDFTGMKQLTSVPEKVAAHVNDGIQSIIDVSKSHDNFVNLDVTKYPDIRVRLAYKHIDYLLEKIKLFDSAIYEALVPPDRNPSDG